MSWARGWAVPPPAQEDQPSKCHSQRLVYARGSHTCSGPPTAHLGARNREVKGLALDPAASNSVSAFKSILTKPNHSPAPGCAGSRTGAGDQAVSVCCLLRQKPPEAAAPLAAAPLPAAHELFSIRTSPSPGQSDLILFLGLRGQLCFLSGKLMSRWTGGWVIEGGTSVTSGEGVGARGRLPL